MSEIVARGVKNGHPIVEIGSGIGYSLTEGVASEVIRIQPSTVDCRLFRKSSSSPIYQLDIEDLYTHLVKSEKKVPLFFALDVFDALPSKVRKESLLQLSQLQNAEDRILIMLDTNPHLESVIEQLEFLHPNHVAFPYFPLGADCTKLAVLLVPSTSIPFKPSLRDLLQIIETEIKNIALKGRPSAMQYKLHQLQEKLNLKVVNLEDFFSDQVKNELEKIGYNTNVYYHNSFTTGEMPKSGSAVNQDLIYKPVTDVEGTVRQWSLNDGKLLDALAKKDIQLPEHFSESFLADLRAKGHKILGAEILVIEAIKA